MLVCVGSCPLTLVSGIGFLGAGTILLRGEAIEGLTTAASLRAVAAVVMGIPVGLKPF